MGFTRESEEPEPGEADADQREGALPQDRDAKDHHEQAGDGEENLGRLLGLAHAPGGQA